MIGSRRAAFRVASVGRLSGGDGRRDQLNGENWWQADVAFEGITSNDGFMNSHIDLARVRNALEELASEAEQRRVWLSTGANGAEVSSFTEACECLFTDTGIGHELDQGRVVFSEEIDAILVLLGQRLSRINSNQAPQQIIGDVRMVEVRSLAKQLLDALPDGRA